jgi:site-specific recombinase XerD
MQEEIMECHGRFAGGPGTPGVVTGPLAPFAGAFGEVLAGKGYSARSAGELMKLAAKLSWWLQDRDVAVADVTAEVIGEFFAERRSGGAVKWRTSRCLAPLAECMGIAPAGRVTGLLARYHRYLLAERGLAAGTTDRYVQLAAAFLAWLPGGEAGIADLRAVQVTACVMHECPRHGGARAKLIVTALRSWLRFLHADGHAGAALAGAVPAAARQRGTRLPAPADRGHLQPLLDACDRRTGLGNRDYAVILVMARLGLRAGEVASLRLADVGWREGLLAVRGKGNRRDVLPLPAGAGDALAGYLTTARPGQPPSPWLFTSAVAPYGPLRTSSAGGIVIRACRRAGIPAFGPHRLRHALACELLACGAALEEIAQLLRHGDLTTTALYARTGLARLAGLVRPCPEGAAR